MDLTVFNILFCLSVKIHFIWHENKDSINSGSADTIQTKCSYQLPLSHVFLCLLEDYSHLVFEQSQFVGFISVRWDFSLAPLNFWEIFLGEK